MFEYLGEKSQSVDLHKSVNHKCPIFARKNDITFVI